VRAFIERRRRAPARPKIAMVFFDEETERICDELRYDLILPAAGLRQHLDSKLVNQFWIPYPGQDVLLCLGIHGQMIYINRPAQLVGVKLSSWPLPQDAWKYFATMAAFDAIAAWVS
jgi:CubicO group peptidase (beta-lactamase class C family)